MGTNVVIGSFERFFRYRRMNASEYGGKNSTFELLKSSVLVAFSGALRIHLAFLLLQVQSSLLTCIAGGLVIYTVYTLDRTLGSKEDTVNRKELSGSRKEVGLAVCLITFLIGSYILAQEGLLIIAFIPFVTCYLYSKGIKIGKYAFKLKGGFGVKNLVVGLTWGIFIAGLVGSSSGKIIPIALIFTFFGIKLFVNSIVFDFKDVKGDTLAGIKTLPVSLGERNTRKLLIGMHFLSHLILGIALIHGLIAFEPLFILYSLICGLLCIQYYTKSDDGDIFSQKIGRAILVDGESTSILGLRMIACYAGMIN
jgi:4-hydroxybenzoate polyprenyltransferase